MNKVNVNIFGKDYTVLGEEDPERIARIAAHVDKKMNEISGVAKDIPLSSVAVLSCMQITDDLFTAREEKEELARTNEQCQADVQHYMQLWEEAKNSFVEFKADSQKDTQELRDTADNLRARLRETERQLEEAQRAQEEVQQVAKEDAGREVEEAKKQYNDLENNYFDLQMENIRLKSELEKLKNRF